MLARRKAFSRASEPDWRLFFGRHFARPTFLALDQAWVRRRHGKRLQDYRTTRRQDDEVANRTLVVSSPVVRWSCYFTVWPLALNCLMASRNSAARSYSSFAMAL